MLRPPTIGTVRASKRGNFMDTWRRRQEEAAALGSDGYVPPVPVPVGGVPAFPTEMAFAKKPNTFANTPPVTVPSSAPDPSGAGIVPEPSRLLRFAGPSISPATETPVQIAKKSYLYPDAPTMATPGLNGSAALVPATPPTRNRRKEARGGLLTGLLTGLLGSLFGGADAGASVAQGALSGYQAGADALAADTEAQYQQQAQMQEMQNRQARQAWQDQVSAIDRQREMDQAEEERLIRNANLLRQARLDRETTERQEELDAATFADRNTDNLRQGTTVLSTIADPGIRAKLAPKFGIDPEVARGLTRAAAPMDPARLAEIEARTAKLQAETKGFLDKVTNPSQKDAIRSFISMAGNPTFSPEQREWAAQQANDLLVQSLGSAPVSSPVTSATPTFGTRVKTPVKTPVPPVASPAVPIRPGAMTLPSFGQAVTVPPTGRLTVDMTPAQAAANADRDASRQMRKDKTGKPIAVNKTDEARAVLEAQKLEQELATVNSKMAQSVVKRRYDKDITQRNPDGSIKVDPKTKMVVKGGYVDPDPAEEIANRGRRTALEQQRQGLTRQMDFWLSKVGLKRTAPGQYVPLTGNVTIVPSKRSSTPALAPSVETDMPPLLVSGAGPAKPTFGVAKPPAHHSAAQPRNSEGQFSGPPRSGTAKRKAYNISVNGRPFTITEVP